jgi:hypothetical protein
MKTFKGLTIVESKILNAISETHPYPFSEVEYVYKKIRSYDFTIKVLYLARYHGIGLDETINKLNILKN